MALSELERYEKVYVELLGVATHIENSSSIFLSSLEIIEPIQIRKLTELSRSIESQINESGANLNSATNRLQKITSVLFVAVVIQITLFVGIFLWYLIASNTSPTHQIKKGFEDLGVSISVKESNKTIVTKFAKPTSVYFDKGGRLIVEYVVK